MGYCLELSNDNRIHHRPVASNRSVNTGDMMNKITADNYFTIIPEWVLYADITATAVRLYGTLQRYADKDSGECHPSRATLATKCNCTVKSIDRALAELIAIGAVIKKQRISPNGDMTSNQYRVITVAGVASKLSLPSDKNDPRGRDKNDIQTIVSMNQSHERPAAQAIADEWWNAYKQRTGGKPPTGKGAWHSLLAVITSALSSGWSEQEVRTAIIACTVPSSAQLDRELNKATANPQTAVQPVLRTMTRRLPIISGDPECSECSGKGVVMLFDDGEQKWLSKKCGCYQESMT
jgi:hypothetical protein